MSEEKKKPEDGDFGFLSQLLGGIPGLSNLGEGNFSGILEKISEFLEKIPVIGPIIANMMTSEKPVSEAVKAGAASLVTTFAGVAGTPFNVDTATKTFEAQIQEMKAEGRLSFEQPGQEEAFISKAKAALESADKNGDGTLDQSEIDSLTAQFAKAAKGVDFVDHLIPAELIDGRPEGYNFTYSQPVPLGKVALKPNFSCMTIDKTGQMVAVGESNVSDLASEQFLGSDLSIQSVMQDGSVIAYYIANAEGMGIMVNPDDVMRDKMNPKVKETLQTLEEKPAAQQPDASTPEAEPVAIIGRIGPQGPGMVAA
ncbi:MAG: hypothetical protein L6Q57_01560 [Alphaproteobacteria bacterium]|nr:hypothetical protein [Alphaproteobacteria bacterium]